VGIYQLSINGDDNYKNCRSPLVSRESSHGSWSSPLAFILAGAGIAIGFSNFWGFPTLVAEHGGGAFLLLYITGLLCMGLPLLMCELVLGRRGRQNPIAALHTLAIAAGRHPSWKFLGMTCVFTAVLILSYYGVIYGWALGYLFRAVLGKFSGQTAQGIETIFSGFIGNPEVLLAWHTVFMVATSAIVARGLRHGLEKANRWLIGTLGIILGVLLLDAGFTHDFTATLARIFTVDFSQVSLRSVLEAMKYAFFSLAAGFGLYLVYGSYMPRKASILAGSMWIVAIDVVVAIVATVIILCLIASGEQQLTDGDTLLFMTIPLGFSHVNGGVLWTTLFYLALVCAALTSSIALLETAVGWVIDTFGIRRLRATIFVGLTAWFIGILTTLSFNQQSPLRFVFRSAGERREYGLFNILEVIASNILVPMLAIGLLFFTVWKMNPDTVRDELNIRDGLGYTIWRGLAGVVAPGMILLVFLYINGIISLK